MRSLNILDPSLTVERLSHLNVQVQVKKGGNYYADIVAPRVDDEEFATLFARAVEEHLDSRVRVISKGDQLARLRCSDLPKHRRDVELLEKLR